MGNRKRTQIIVDDLDWQQLKRIDEKRDKMSLLSDSNLALRRAKKEAYFLVTRYIVFFKCIIYLGILNCIFDQLFYFI